MNINDELLYKHIGHLIKDQRRKLSITQDELAENVGVTRTSITNIESGFQKLPLHLLYSICATLELDVINILPPMDEVMVQKGQQTIETDGQAQQVSHKTKNIVLALQDLLDNDDKSKNSGLSGS